MRDCNEFETYRTSTKIPFYKYKYFTTALHAPRHRRRLLEDQTWGIEQERALLKSMGVEEA